MREVLRRALPRDVRGARSEDVEAALQEVPELRAELARTRAHLAVAEAGLECMQHQLRNVPLHFTVGQYNMLAGYLGNNTEPWFLYGIDVCEDRRRRITQLFVERDASGQYANRGWPNYVRGVLSEEEIVEVERVHRQSFMWDRRKDRIVDVIRALDVDLLSIVECDHYEDFFQPVLQTMGYDTIWAQRPRPTSHDGCCIAWRSRSFECLASKVVEYHDPPARRKGQLTFQAALVKDRLALLTLMRSRVTGDTLIFASTHLARNPEEKELDGLRSRQISQVIRGIADFSQEHNAHRSAVVLTGDLNATAFERLIGIASVGALLREGGRVPHPFVFDCKDVPSRPTSVTKARRMRIDAILYQGKRMQLLDMYDAPELTMDDPIPNDSHPSDHVPVKATFRLRSWLEVTKQAAREWFLRYAGRGSYASLTPQELADAFVLYDHDGCGTITAREMSRTVSELMGNGTVSPASLERVFDQFPKEGMQYPQFVEAFKEATVKNGVPGLQDIKDVFHFFDKDDSSMLELPEFHAMLTDCSPVPAPPEEVEAMFDSIDTDGDGLVSMDEYLHHITQVWIKRFGT